VEFCERKFKRALEGIQFWVRTAGRRNGELYTKQEFGRITDSYAKGYIAGIHASFRRRTGTQDQAMVPASSTEVDRAVEKMNAERIVSGEEVMGAIFSIGYHDGLRFDAVCQLELQDGTDESSFA